MESLYTALKLGTCDAKNGSKFTENIFSIVIPAWNKKVNNHSTFNQILKMNNLVNKCPIGTQKFTGVDDHPCEDRKWNENDSITVCDNLLILISSVLNDLHVVSREICYMLVCFILLIHIIL